MYRTLGRFYPRKVREKYKKMLGYAGLKIDVEKFVGFLLFSSIFVALAISLILARITLFSVFLLFPSFLILMQVLAHMLLLLKADAKAKFVEDVLPDALQLMSSNLRAGLTTDKALMLSVRPEFGPLSDELNLVGKEIAVGKDINQALLDMSTRIKSEKLHKTVLLITSSLKAGGELAPLLSLTSQNLRNQKFIDEKTKASVLMYVIFIFSAICFGSPILFGLSSFLVEVLAKNIGAIEIAPTAAAQFPVAMTKVAISSGFITTFVLVCLVTASILGSLVLGLIRKGSERGGLRFIPIMLVLTISIFFLVRFLMSRMLGSIFLGP